jgi:hypothetical protein
MKDPRLAALRRFATAITIINLLGHLFFGFESSWAQLAVSAATAYASELLLELIDARVNRRPLAFRGGPVAFINFLLPAHITGWAIAMLMYSGDRLLPFAFAAAVAIASKAIFQAPGKGGLRHFLNPSNTGLTATFLLFPATALSVPYQYTENFLGYGDVVLPSIVICIGTFLNWRFTRRLPLVLAFLGGWILQAVLRSVLVGHALIPALAPMTGMAFLLFTYYMVPDPGTTPSDRRGQIIFGASVALVYGALVALHVVFGMIFGLAIVCGTRGLLLWLADARARRQATVPASAPLAPAAAEVGVVMAPIEVGRTAPRRAEPDKPLGDASPRRERLSGRP